MAGARCGVALAHPDIIALLQKVRAPYPISSPSSHLVLEALSGREACERRIDVIRQERCRLAKALAVLPSVEKVFPSEANFLLVKARDNARFIAACGDRGIIVRDRGTEPGLEGCIRISVGSAAENEALLKAIREEGGESGN
jgi:histidinol-phosphate aminotransferase